MASHHHQLYLLTPIFHNITIKDTVARELFIKLPPEWQRVGAFIGVTKASFSSSVGTVPVHVPVHVMHTFAIV